MWVRCGPIAKLPGHRLRERLLYAPFSPADIQSCFSASTASIYDFKGRFGAGSGNRTRVFSLEGCCTTIVLYPPCPFAQHSASPAHLWAAWSSKTAPHNFRKCGPIKIWWRGLDSNQRRHSQRIYSPPPLATRAPLQSLAARRTAKTKQPREAMRSKTVLWEYT
jgi:hypothetical protein